MPIPFTCPYCGRQTTVADQYAGQTGPCAGCGKSITVPAAGTATAFAPPAKKSGGGLLVLGIVAGVFAVILVCGGILVALLLPAVQGAREAARRAQCTNNLKQIALAMHNYHDTFGSFPPAYIADENGKPMHSWRVLILPFLDESPLYDQYDFNEPWDGPNNSMLADLMPSAYTCPSEPMPGTDTAYVMIVGPGTISDGPSATRLSDITDGASNTLLVVEAAGSGINWMEPRDLDAQTMSYQINDPLNTQSIKSYHPGGANVAKCDAAVVFLNDQMPAELVEGMSTIADGDVQIDFPNF